jgi:hypothetical protein
MSNVMCLSTYNEKKKLLLKIKKTQINQIQNSTIHTASEILINIIIAFIQKKLPQLIPKQTQRQFLNSLWQLVKNFDCHWKGILSIQS